jgi:hypothetical protein
MSFVVRCCVLVSCAGVLVLHFPDEPCGQMLCFSKCAGVLVLHCPDEPCGQMLCFSKLCWRFSVALS